jgi:signal transduction histidine kinase/DNA-binding NarL/FixJ family response regulator/HPt (histidine-containing phosphotransfer) domain-containing protein
MEHMHSSYSLPLVALSYLVAVLASHVTLSLAQRLRPSGVSGPEHAPHWPWIVGGAFSMGTGIWSMHFIGMLAFHLPIEMVYDLGLTAASYVIAVVVSGFALLIFRRNDPTIRGIAVPGLFIGFGICAMHYTGMAAMQMSPAIDYDAVLFAASVVIALGAAMAALWIAFSLPQGHRHHRWHKLAAASVMGAAIVGMHYTGMAAANFSHDAVSMASGPRVDTTWLAITISAFTFLILGSTLLLSVIDAQLQSTIARSAEELMRANEDLEQRVADRTLHLTREQARAAALLTDLHAAKEVAEAASRAKSAFLATISHEIRTPMNAILGLLELLSYSHLDDEQRETVGLLRDSSGSLLRLIDDILDFSKIEAGKLDLRSEPTRLRPAVDQLTQMFAGVASAKGLTLTSAVDDDVPEHVLVDGLRLRQVLSNFLSNAIKFTERGSIRFEVRSAPLPGQPDLVRFAVADSGIGMDAETISRLCEPFVQGDTRTSRRYGGTGLGLAICRRLAELMTGRLHIESAPRKGTTVSLVLPLPKVAPIAQQTRLTSTDTHADLTDALPSRAPAVATAAAAGELILVVDDHPTNRRLLVRQLAWIGYAAEAVADGTQALAFFLERRAAGTPYALVITDCQMPEMDGYELARRIRETERGDGKRAVVLAFTANTLREAADECHAAGMDDVLTKPIELKDLKARLEHWLPPRTWSIEARSAEADDGGRAKAESAADTSLTGEFCLAHDEDMGLLRDALREQRPDRVARAAHRIKGAARMYGDGALADAAAKLEEAAHAGAWQATEAAADRVNGETDRLFARTGWSRQSRRA